MKKIALTRGQFATVDDEDYPRLIEMASTCKWRAKLKHEGRPFAKWYAYQVIKRDGKRFGLWMHRAIMGEPEGLHVDHINGDGLDNRRPNLRIATAAQNQYNRHHQQSNNTSGYRGVMRARPAQSGKERWVAVIYVNTKAKYLGTFPTKEQAASAYSEQARIVHGEFYSPLEDRP